MICADLLGVGLAHGATEHGEVLREAIHEAAVDLTPARDDAIAGDALVGHTEVIAAMRDVRADLDERAGVVEQLQSLARGQAPLGVDLRDALRAASGQGLVAAALPVRPVVARGSRRPPVRGCTQSGERRNPLPQGQVRARPARIGSGGPPCYVAGHVNPHRSPRSPEEPMSQPTISERIQTEMVKAMKEKDADTLSTVRMLKAALMEAKTAKPKDSVLSEAEEIEILQRYVKKRRETIDMNNQIGKPELNAAEEREIAVTMRFLPQLLSEDEVAAIVKEAVASTGAAGPKDMGKVIGAVMAKVAKGTVEGSTVSRLVKAALGG
jgi:uncharacterized protein YqeY